MNVYLIGAEAAVDDFVAGREIASNALPPEARVISRAFAPTAITSSVSNEPILTPDTLNALLIYRADTAAYSEFLDFATDEKLIASVVPNSADRSWLALSFLHSAATCRRRLGGKQNIERAREILASTRDFDVETSVNSSEKFRAERLVSSILYDLAYIDYLTERPSAARNGFHASAEMARKAQNPGGYHISRILEHLVGFYGGEVTARKFHAILEEALEYFAGAGKESPHAERWLRNIHAHLFDLACLSGDACQAATELAILERDTWVIKSNQLDVVTWRARYHIVRHAWSKAVSLYRSILEDGISHPDLLLVREGIARDLLDYGTALAALGLTDLARQVWRRGLRSSEYACGWPWKMQIADRLAQLDS